MTEIRHITQREMALERENARLVDKTERQSATIHVQAVAIQAMKADAERYQWLRSQQWTHGTLTVVAPDKVYLGSMTYSGEMLDHRLDEAMKESK